MIYAIAALFVCQLVGEVIVESLALPIPGPLLGMALLFTALILLGRVPEQLNITAGKLFRHMMLFFIPIVVGVMMHAERMAAEWLPFMAACLVGAAVTLVVTALSFAWMLKLTRRTER